MLAFFTVQPAHLKSHGELKSESGMDKKHKSVHIRDDQQHLIRISVYVYRNVRLQGNSFKGLIYKYDIIYISSS